MATIKFNSNTVAQLKPGIKSVEYFAENFNPGYAGSLGLRLSPKGKKTWFIRYRISKGGTAQKFTLGTCPAMSFTEAKQVATMKLKIIAEGGDPVLERQQQLEAPTVDDLWDLYQEGLRNLKKKKADSTLAEENRRWEKVIKPAIGQMKVADIKPHHLNAMLREVAKTAPVSANRLHALLQVMFKPALAEGWIDIHPLQHIGKPGGTEMPRKRVLNDDEIKVLWPCFDSIKPNPRDILRLILLTGQRPGEIMSLRWQDIDFGAGVICFKDTKVGNDHLVPISTQVMAILKEREQISEWVFPSSYNKAKGAISGRAKTTKDARKRLKELSGVLGWSAHDLRRTARTLMSRLKIPPHIRERVINHSQGKIVDTYDQYDYLDEKRDALQKLSDEIFKVVGF